MKNKNVRAREVSLDLVIENQSGDCAAFEFAHEDEHMFLTSYNYHKETEVPLSGCEV